MKIINETEDAWQLENGLWYQKGLIHWGICPRCGDYNMYVRHIWSTEYKVCENCMVSWEIGSNLCSAWKDMCTEEDFMETFELLSQSEDAYRIYTANPLPDEAKEMLIELRKNEGHIKTYYEEG